MPREPATTNGVPRAFDSFERKPRPTRRPLLSTQAETAKAVFGVYFPMVPTVGGADASRVGKIGQTQTP